jgi:hypothetical protein
VFVIRLTAGTFLGSSIVLNDQDRKGFLFIGTDTTRIRVIFVPTGQRLENAAASESTGRTV